MIRQDHLHWEFDAHPRDTLMVTIDRPANVLLLDDANYQKYCAGVAHAAYGGLAEKGDTMLKPYRPGKWHVVVDMGRSGGQVSASVRNSITKQPIGTPQGRYLSGAASKA